MAKVTSSRKLIVEDFPATSRELIERLSRTLNPHLDQVASALSNNLTLRDNFKAKVWQLDLVAGVSSYKVSWDLNEKPTDVRIGNIRKADGSAVAAVAAVSWLYKNQTIELTFLGLDGAFRHSVTVIGQI